jgi:hypothetical protein
MDDNPDNLNQKNIISMLKMCGINIEDFSIEKLEELMKLTDSIENPKKITPEMSKKILNIIKPKK